MIWINGTGVYHVMNHEFGKHYIGNHGIQNHGIWFKDHGLQRVMGIDLSIV